MSRSSDYVRNLPPVTFGIVGLCCALHVALLLFDWDLHQFTMCPRNVLYLHEYYRIVSSTLFHGSMMHIAMNMMSIVAISTTLEQKLGSLRLLFTILWSILLTNVIYLIGAVFMSSVLGKDGLMYQHAIGFSGVIFHLSVLECNIGPESSHTRSVFGFFNVPSYSYPIFLLVALQFFMPNLSFMGHLAGIISGTFQTYGILDFFALIDDSYLASMEEWALCRRLRLVPSFVPTPTPNEFNTFHMSRNPSSGLMRVVVSGCWMVLAYMGHILRATKVILFGRGGEANSNLYLWSSTPLQPTNSLLSAASVEVSDDEDEEDWVGLPPAPSPRGTSLV